ncbi:intradiol ring-cleavage dioxygenase [Seonamhaeicola sp.]|uniref:dioxygenase family protein n=1 Tax=Seonamhaeicola sp. TaxID=1912245 RepID=UPI002635B4E8|nr:intradiol ring-cleavage dioxygenase [Seonamhaeicola sp.]
MDRKIFLKNGIKAIGIIAAVPTLVTSCESTDEEVSANSCTMSPRETAGPFPIKTPADLVRENIIGNKQGVPLLMKFVIQNVNQGCSPLAGVYVDVWHCDAKGNYSEYSDQLDGNFTNESFLRGRQTTDNNGNASFISIYPGWYPGRTPHLHVEIKDSSNKSLLITQVSFPDTISNTVYATTGYKGTADTNNLNDGIVDNSNLADSVTGNASDGYTLIKTIKVPG